MRLETLFGMRGVQIAAFVAAIAIAVLGNNVLSGFGPDGPGPDSAAPAEIEKAASGASALMGWDATDAALDGFAEEVRRSSSCATQDEPDWFLDEILDLQALCKEACTCGADSNDASGECSCCGHSDQKSDKQKSAP